MVTRAIRNLAVPLLVLALAAPARAAAPTVHHAPLAVAPAHAPLTVEAEVTSPHRVRRVVIVYRVGTDPTLHSLELQRAGEGYAVDLPASHLTPPGLRYAIEVETTEGARIPAFASREALHPVAVREAHAVVRERALLARVHGARSTFSASGEYVDFGRSEAEIVRAGEFASVERWRVRDRYFRAEGGYTYRPLRTISEFTLRIGVIRGQSPVADQTWLTAGETPAFDVGLNYGAPSVELMLHDLVRLELEALASVTEIGFSTGMGAALKLGYPYATQGTLGFEAIEVFGTRLFSRLDVVASPRLTVSPIIELTNMPHADRFGVRLLSELTLRLGRGVGIAARGGYQARDFESGGLGVGATASYSF